jgi:hypothetical protein
MRRLLTALAVGAICAAVATPSAAGGTGRPAKSLKKAMLLSFVLPGAGQQYMGNTGRARTMFAAEAGVWAAFATYRVQGHMREARYKETARLFAQVEREKSDGYYTLLAYYLSSDEFNVDVAREARALFPDDRERQLEYISEQSYSGEDGWEWDSVERMNQFARERTASRESYRRATLTTGFAVLNRMISMIDVYLSFKLHREGSGSTGLGLGMEADPEGGVRVFLRASL